jgi:ATPase subunit of ABC transporter with duplicated ATPase domains
LVKDGCVSIADTIWLYCRLSALSGHERNRLLPVMLFIFPSNALVLDKPAGALDAETLDRLKALEEEPDGACGRCD